MIIILTLFMSGCNVDIEEYYRANAKMELGVIDYEMLDHDLIFVSRLNYYDKVTYQEKYTSDTEIYFFRPRFIYAYCEYDICNEISKELYEGVIQ